MEGASTTAPDLEVYLDDAIMRVNDAFNLETISRHTVIDRKPVPPPTVTRQQLRAKQRTEDAYWNARRKEVAQMERQMRLAKVKRNKETTKARLAEISQPSILSR